MAYNIRKKIKTKNVFKLESGDNNYGNFVTKMDESEVRKKLNKFKINNSDYDEDSIQNFIKEKIGKPSQRKSDFDITF